MLNTHASFRCPCLLLQVRTRERTQSLADVPTGTWLRVKRARDLCQTSAWHHQSLSPYHTIRKTDGRQVVLLESMTVTGKKIPKLPKGDGPKEMRTYCFPQGQEISVHSTMNTNIHFQGCTESNVRRERKKKKKSQGGKKGLKRMW